MSDGPSEDDAVRVAEETLELRPIDEARFAAPLSFPIVESETIDLHVDEGKFRGEFDLVRANPDGGVVLEPADFLMRKVGGPFQKVMMHHGGAVLWWKDVEVVAEAEVSQAAFYDLLLTVRGYRMYDVVPRLELLVDGETVSELDLQVPRRHEVTVVGAGRYVEKGRHICAVRLLTKTVDPEQDIPMGVHVLKMELVPKDMVVVPADSAPVGSELTARYVTRNRAPEQWRRFAKEHDLMRTDQGLFVSRETGLDVQGEYRPAIFAPAGTIFEWTVRLPRQPELAVGMATAPTTWSNVPSHVKFTVDVIPHGLWKRRQTLFEETVDSWSQPANGKWRDITLDLERWAGRKVTLRFATTSPGTEAADCSYSFWGEPHLRGPTETNKNYNVVIHLIDTVRTDHLGCYGYDGDTSPTIDALAETGILFENPVSQWPATKGSTASLLTGLYPVAHGVHIGGTVHERAQMLAQALAAQGYLTFAISDNQVITCERGFGRGCDRFYWMVNRYGSEMPLQTPARFIMNTLTQCLEVAAGHPFFLYVHSVYPHDNYWAPREFREMFTGEYEGIVDGKIKTCRRRGNEFTENDFRQVLGLYDAEIRYADALTKYMLDSLEEANLSENTVFVLTADHGEEFMDHGAWGHCHSLFGELLNVPLIIKGPPFPSHKRIPQTVRLIDVAPTLLDILELPSMDCHGETLLPLIRGEDVRWRTATSEAGTRDAPSISIRHERYKYVRTKRVKEARIREGEFLFDSVNDPSEQHSLLEEEPELVEQMKAEVERYYEQYGEWFGERAGQSLSDLSPEELRDLKALGYVR
jgi:arylsulfatase A-like enzyme